MHIAVPAETAPQETRVAIVPRSVAQLSSAGGEVVVQAGAGAAAGFSDDAYIEAGAAIEPNRRNLLSTADLTVVVRRPTLDDLRLLKPGSAIVGMLDPAGDPGPLLILTERRISAFRMEAVPRISRAQDMDVLSSMATLSGYYAAILAAYRLPRIFPLLMTAAGTITPARVLVLGAGVAGLQAIATARRLGAVVEAYDVRPAVREQVESLGARFVEVGVESEEHQDAGGYAKELSADAQQREHEVLGQHVMDADVVITTALIPGKAAPLLITRDTVAGMRLGSVIVDLAAAGGGNTELTEADAEVVTDNGVLIVGPTNLAAALPGQASQLYSNNVTRFLLQIVKNGQISLDFNDVVVGQTAMTHDGVPRGEQMLGLLAGATG